MGLLRFTFKSSVVGGLVYYTIQEGLWSNSEESGKFYNKLHNLVTPWIHQNVPQDVIEEIHHIPNPSHFKEYIASYWNKGVITSIKFLSELPLHASNGVDKIKKEIEKSNLSGGEPATATVSK